MKIPKNAKKVFKGEIFDVYQWEQEMYDGSKETFEMLKRADTVQVIATSKNKIYYNIQEQPNSPKSYASLFGGRVDPGEKPLGAAKRELLEESGLVSNDWELFKVKQVAHRIDWEVYIYIARNCKQVADQNLDPGERITVKETDFEGFIEMTSQEDFWWEPISNIILRISQDKNKLAEFKKKLFS